jgi:hypothetical protein
MTRTVFKTATLAFAVLAMTTITASAQFVRVTVPGSTPTPTAPGAASTGSYSVCGYDLGFMRRPSTRDIAAIGNHSVVLNPVCEDSFTNRHEIGSLFDDGNVTGLRPHIARNATLMSALRAGNYDHDDVVALRFGANNSVILYVHQRGR